MSHLTTSLGTGGPVPAGNNGAAAGGADRGALGQNSIGQASSDPVAAAEVAATVPVSWVEFACGLVALASWFFLFGGGILVGTEGHRAAIAGPADVPHALRSMAVVFAFWTITNVGLLACVAALLGAVGRRTRFAVQAATPAPAYVDLIPADVWSHYASAVIRGFSVYGLVLAGLLVFATETFIKPTQSEYLRIASTISVMAFYAGYDPDVLAGMLTRVRRLMDGDSGRAAGATQEARQGARAFRSTPQAAPDSTSRKSTEPPSTRTDTEPKLARA